MGTSNCHERSEDVARTLEPCCESCGLPIERGSFCVECQKPRRDERIEDGELEPEDAERLAGQAEEQGEDR